MPDLLTDALRQSTIATFENLAMMVAEATDDLPEEPWQPRVTSVRFDGGTDAWLELEVSQELLPEVAQCMLGHQGLISAAITDDVLGELANVIAGNLLAHLSATETVRLSPPRLEPCGIARPPAAQACFVVDDCAVEARLYLQGPTGDSRSDR